MLTLDHFLIPSKFIQPERQLELYNLHSLEIRNSEEGLKTVARIRSFMIEAEANIKYRYSLQNAKFKTLSDKIISGNQLLVHSKQLTLLIFGASWCGPCRSENALLLSQLPTIDTSKVKVIGLSADSNEQSWKNAVKNDKCNWESLIIEGGTNSDFFKKIVPSGTIPFNLLVDSDGKILRKHVDINEVLKLLPLKN